MKQETLISGIILTVVTAVVIGVWSHGFGLFNTIPARPGTGEVAAPTGLWTGVNPPRVGVVGLTPPAGPGQGEMVPVAAGTMDGVVEAVAPKPPNYVPDQIQSFEGHWQGMDVRLLTAELRSKLRYPQGLDAVLVGEVTLAAARAGLLAGDVIVAVAGQPVSTIETFQEATRAIANQRQTTVSVLRKTASQDQTGNRSTMIRLTLAIASDRELGFAQIEGAPMIKAGDPRPHPYRGPCTQCHSIGSGFELTPDPDLITLPPPPLTRDVITKGIRPHEDRGPCLACHVVTP